MNQFEAYISQPITKKQVILYQSNIHDLTVYKPKSKASKNSFNYDIQFPTSTVSIDSQCDWFLQGKRNGRIALWRFEDTRPSASSRYDSNNSINENGEVSLKSKKHTSTRTPLITLGQTNNNKESYDPVYHLKWYARDNGMFFQVGQNRVRVWDTNAMEAVYECESFNLESNTKYKLDVHDDYILYGEQLIDLRTLTSHVQIKGESRITSNSIFHFDKGNTSPICVCTGHVDGIVNIWDLRNLKKPLSTTKVGTGMINDISINQKRSQASCQDIWVVHNGTTVYKLWAYGSKVLSSFKTNMGSKITSLSVDQDEKLMYCQDSKNVSIYFYKNIPRNEDQIHESTNTEPENIEYKYWSQIKPPDNTTITCMDFQNNYHLFGLQNGGIAEWIL